MGYAYKVVSFVVPGIVEGFTTWHHFYPISALNYNLSGF